MNAYECIMFAFKVIAIIFHVYFLIVHADESFGLKDPLEISTTEAFFVTLTKEAFGRTFQPNDQIEFIPSISGMPDLPKWIKYLHTNASDNAFLYGTPSPNDDGDIDIEIVAMNKYNYDTVIKTMKFRVTSREKVAKYEVEIKFLNANIEDMFVGDRLRDVWQIFNEKLWKDNENVYITKIASPKEMGGRLPLDPKEKEGVIIRIGGIDNYTRDLLDLDREVEVMKKRNPCPRGSKATSAEYMFRNKGFHSDWCSFRLIKHESEILIYSTEPTIKKHPSSSIASVNSSDTNYDHLSVPFPKRDYWFDVIFCIVIPLIVGIMVVSSLTCVFFYNKEERSKVNQQTPSVQMQQYNTIQRMSTQLRSLGQSRGFIPTDSNSTLPHPRPILKLINPHTTLPKATSMNENRSSTLRHISKGIAP